MDYIKGSFLCILGQGQGTELCIFLGVGKISNIFRGA